MDSVEKWDSAARDYQRVYSLGGSDYSAAMMAFWESEGLVHYPCRVLDIGCGVGKYGAAFAKRGCDVTLTDISGEMLRHAEKNMAFAQTPWRVYKCDFDAVTGEEDVFSAGFDFSISTMSPAVHDVETVRKMADMTRGWCFLTRFCRWEQPERDAVLRTLGMETGGRNELVRRDSVEITELVRAAGYVPHIKYVEYNWCDMRTASEMADYMIRNYIGEDSPEIRARVTAAVEPLCDEGGLFRDAVNTDVLWLYWNKSETD